MKGWMFQKSARRALCAQCQITETGPALGKPFWTIGFEAFNDETREKHILEEVLQLELGSAHCPTELKRYLTPEYAAAYPDWLAKAR
jgi:hypothetical protein